VREFHAADCADSRGEFDLWNRTETDYLRKQLRGVIIKSKVIGYGFACIRKDLDDEIEGDLRSFLGDPEGYAIRSCFVQAMSLATRFTFDPDISFVFDYKPERELETRAIFNTLKKHFEDKSVNGLSFLDSLKFTPLQAADLFAWEFNKYAVSLSRNRPEIKIPKETAHLQSKMYYYSGQIAESSGIKRLKEYILSENQDHLAAAAAHFRKESGRENFFIETYKGVAAARMRPSGKVKILRRKRK
jgi:hypothetical protein